MIAAIYIEIIEINLLEIKSNKNTRPHKDNCNNRIEMLINGESVKSVRI